MRLILATAAALTLTIAGGSVTHAACCDVIPGVPPTPPPAPGFQIREAPAAVFLFPGPPPVFVPGELLPGPPPVFLTDSPLAPRPPQRFDVLTR